jgi:hypothetical protein
MINFIESSHARTSANDSGLPITNLHWTYWALNTEDGYGLLGNNYAGLANAKKQYSFLCQIQSWPFALPQGTGTGQCGSTGALPAAQ